MNIGAGNNINNPLEMLECLICTSAKDYATNKRDFMLYGIICGWEGVPHDKYPLDEECANELDEMHEQYETLKKMFNDNVKPVVHGHWNHRYDTALKKECSVCKALFYLEAPYCFVCGSKMDEDGETNGH